jgi:hypothetical protein
MKLYLVQYDGECYYVEATDFGDAIGLWRAHVRRAWGADFDGTEEPESVALMHEDAVIRAEDAP